MMRPLTSKFSARALALNDRNSKPQSVSWTHWALTQPPKSSTADIFSSQPINAHSAWLPMPNAADEAGHHNGRHRWDAYGALSLDIGALGRVWAVRCLSPMACRWRSP